MGETERADRLRAELSKIEIGRGTRGGVLAHNALRRESPGEGGGHLSLGDKRNRKKRVKEVSVQICLSTN